MANRIQRIFELSHNTAESLSEYKNWVSLLKTAAWQYKYPFEDQVLIYAQRPDATACASIEVWNKNMHRWIKKGAKGIALLRENGSRYGLEYVFDVSDTNDRYNRNVRLWQYDERYDDSIIETLGNTFGELKVDTTITDAIISAAHNTVQDNKQDYIHELGFVKNNSFLHGLDDVNLDFRFRQTAEVSVAYIIMQRMGLEPDNVFSEYEFQYIRDFNTVEAINILGNAVSSISETALRNISETIRAEQRKFAQEKKAVYNDNRNTTNQRNQEERNDENDRKPNLQQDRRLPVAEFDSANRRKQDRQIRYDEENISQAEPQESVLNLTNEWNIANSFGGDRQDSNGTNTESRSENGESRGSDRSNEVERANALDTFDEQLPSLGGRDSDIGTGIQLNLFDIPLPTEEEQKNFLRQAEQRRSAFAISQQIIDEVLTSGSNEKNSILNICTEYSKNKSSAENIEFLKKEYRVGGKGFVFDGSKISVWWNNDGIKIARGESAVTSRNFELITWEQADKRVKELLELGRYAPQEILDKTSEYERKMLSSAFWYMERDINYDEYPELHELFDDAWFKGGYPDSTARINSMLENPKDIEKLMSVTSMLDTMYSGNKYIMRWRTYSPDKVLKMFDDFQREHVHFTSNEYQQSMVQRFITEDEINKLFTRGSGMDRGKIRIYLYFKEHTDLKERIQFLKKEYGTGGYSSGIFRGWHDAKGISFSREDIFSPFSKVNIKWNEATKRIDRLIKSGRYMTEKEIAEDIPKYISEQEEQKRRHDMYIYLRDMDKLSPEEKRETLPKRILYLTQLIENYEREFFGEYGILDLLDKSEIYIADAIKDTDIRSNLITCMDKIRGATTDATRRNCARGIAEELSELKTINLHRIGDFYEIYGDEAIEAANVLQITPIKKHIDNGEVDMVGFSAFTVERYVKELSNQGFMVSIEEDNDVSQTALEQGQMVLENNQTALEQGQVVDKKDITPVFEKPTIVSNTVIYPEIPVSERHNFVIENDELGHGTLSQKYQANVTAIRLLKRLESEHRLATQEEQQILSEYVGWGGLADCFDEKHSKYSELKSLLTDEEYKSARESTLTAFYTPPVVIQSIYKALENMGLKQGNILDPAMGIGNFEGMLPDSLNDCKVYGIEIDSISGRIAQQLYQKNSVAIQGYEDTTLPDSFFDVAIGNVPFGQFKVMDKKYDKHNFLIHDYFFAKTLDKVRPGGVIAFVTSSGTMDKRNSNVRKYIAQRADLLGAIRLPDNTFKANAGTEVTSDILFLQKRDRMTDITPEWVHLGTNENGHTMNQYFVDNPDMVLGEMVEESGPFGMQLNCKPYEDADLNKLLDNAIQNIHAQITEYEFDDISNDEDLSIPADPNVKNFSYTIVDSDIYFRENSRMNKVDVSLTAQNRIKGMIEIRDCVRELIEYQTADYPDYEIKSQQKKLNNLYDSFIVKYGLINSRGNSNAFSNDSSYFLLCSLEILNENGELERKADMFSKRTIGARKEVTQVDTATEALAVSIGEKARIDMEFMSSLTGKAEQELYEDLKGVIFLNPLYSEENLTQEKYINADEYLSGNVREKLELAKRSVEIYPEDYTVNVEALTKVQPKDLTASEITVRLGTTWIPPEYIRDFTFELLSPSYSARRYLEVKYSKLTGDWNIVGKNYDKVNVKANNTYGTKRINAYKIIEETLNLKDVRIFDYVENENGNRVPVLNRKETTIAQQKQDLIKSEFDNWIWKDPERRETLVRIYNEKFNSVRPREYDGSHIRFSGMNPEIELRKHQQNAVARIMYGGNSLLGHVVGAGKTWTMVAAAMESKRLGLCNKSLFVVPNHLTEQWASEFLQLYPAANILVATRKDFETKNRKKFCGRIATGDYDAIIIGHSQFEKIPMSAERQRAILESQLDEIIDGIRGAKADKAERFTVKQMEKSKRGIEAKLKKLNDTSRKDDVVTFEELGVDRLFVDEAHYYKNLFLYTKMRNVGGIAQTEAQKSSDLFMKCRYLDEITGGKGTILATGTPISNSMVELYTMQRYLQHDTLVKNDLQHFDAWASTFGETVTAIELAPEGSGYRAKTRFAKFFNLPELMTMFKEVADIQTSDMLNLPVPQAEYHNVAVEPTAMQKDMVAELSNRADDVRNKQVDPSEDNMLKITNDGRKLALDQRLINPLLPDDEHSKVSACVNNVFDIWEKTADSKSAQLVFCDLSTPKGEDTFSVYTDIRDKLLKRGVPESDIAFIHDADSEVKKKELFSKVRKGDVRILLGSTQKMGAGTNVQTKLVALHDLDCPWRPSDLEQRSGRIIRQGNTNEKVDIFRYVTKDTFDAYMFQLVENKQKFISQVMTSKSPVRSAEDIDETALSYAEIKALATGNLHIKEKMDLDTQVAKLKLIKSNFMSQKYELEDKVIKYYPTQISDITTRIAGMEKDIEVLKKYPKTEGKFYTMTIDGLAYYEKEKAGNALIERCKAMTTPDPITIGDYRGFSMELSFDTFRHEHILVLRSELRHPVELGADVFGNLQRIDNVLEGMEKRLETYRIDLEETKKQFEIAKVECKKEFPQEQELTEKTQRLAALDALLNMDKRENEGVDMSEPDEEVPKKKKEIER